MAEQIALLSNIILLDQVAQGDPVTKPWGNHAREISRNPGFFLCPTRIRKEEKRRTGLENSQIPTHYPGSNLPSRSKSEPLGIPVF